MNDPKRVVFTSQFGTGKTFLMKEKAKEILRKKKAWRKSGINCTFNKTKRSFYTQTYPSQKLTRLFIIFFKVGHSHIF